MNKKIIFVFILFVLSTKLFATPSTVYWTPCTTYFQPFMKGHITYDSYVRGKSMLQNDYGFTVGVLPFDKVQMEIGYDALLPVTNSNDEASFVNAKIGWSEETLLPFGFAVGIFNKGFRPGVTTYDIFYAVVGKTFNKIGTFAAGVYSGNSKILVNEDGDADNTGLMLSYSSPKFSHFVIAADLMSGKNSLSAWGLGLYTYFTDSISLLVGPVFPFAKTFTGNGHTMWTVQIDIDFNMI